VPNTASGSCYLPTKFSQLPNLHTFITSSLFSVSDVLALHLSLPLLGHQHRPLKITDRSFCYVSSCLWSLEPTPSISSSTSFWYQFLHFLLTYSFTHHFFLFWFITMLIHYFHSWLKTYLFHKSYHPPLFHFLPECITEYCPDLGYMDGKDSAKNISLITKLFLKIFHSSSSSNIA